MQIQMQSCCKSMFAAHNSLHTCMHLHSSVQTSSMLVMLRLHTDAPLHACMHTFFSCFEDQACQQAVELACECSKMTSRSFNEKFSTQAYQSFNEKFSTQAYVDTTHTGIHFAVRPSCSVVLDHRSSGQSFLSSTLRCLGAQEHDHAGKHDTFRLTWLK